MPRQLVLRDRPRFDLPFWYRTAAFPPEASLSAGGALGLARLALAAVPRKSV